MRSLHYTATVHSSSPWLFATLKAPNPAISAPREPPSFDIVSEERVLKICGRGACVGCVDHARALPPRAGACRGASERPPRCHVHPVAQGLRVHGRHSKGCLCEAARQAELGAPSSCLPTIRCFCVMLSRSSPYSVPAPVGHIYCTKYSCG
jgi:hypothetical protein